MAISFGVTLLQIPYDEILQNKFMTLNGDLQIKLCELNMKSEWYIKCKRSLNLISTFVIMRSRGCDANFIYLNQKRRHYFRVICFLHVFMFEFLILLSLRNMQVMHINLSKVAFINDN